MRSVKTMNSTIGSCGMMCVDSIPIHREVVSNRSNAYRSRFLCRTLWLWQQEWTFQFVGCNLGSRSS